jgi:predicted transcriptional regulator
MKNKLKAMTIRISEELSSLLLEYASKKGISSVDVVREALSSYLAFNGHQGDFSAISEQIKGINARVGKIEQALNKEN